jgi:hypothetical protein
VLTDDGKVSNKVSGKGPATVMIGKGRKIRESDWQTWLDSLEASAPAQPKASPPPRPLCQRHSPKARSPAL